MREFIDKLSKIAFVGLNILALWVIWISYDPLIRGTDKSLAVLGNIALILVIVVPVVIGDLALLAQYLRRNPEGKTWKRLAYLVVVSIFSFIVVWLGIIFWPESGEKEQATRSLTATESEQLIKDCQVSSVRQTIDQIIIELRPDSNFDGYKTQYLPSGVWPSIEAAAVSAKGKCEHEIKITD